MSVTYFNTNPPKAKRLDTVRYKDTDGRERVATVTSKGRKDGQDVLYLNNNAWTHTHQVVEVVSLKSPKALRKADLAKIVGQLQEILWFEFDIQDGKAVGVINDEKEWDIETIDYVSGVLTDAGLGPQTLPRAGD